MKTTTTLIVFLTMFISIVHGQSTVNEIQKINIYAVSWDIKSPMAHNIKNIKKFHSYFFQTDDVDLNKMFIDYKDCSSKLNAQKEFKNPSDTSNNIKTKILVELIFKNKKKLDVFFDYSGNYYFAGKWHVRNNEFYYLLFKYFSNEIIPQTTLDDAKKNYIDDFWHGN